MKKNPFRDYRCNLLASDEDRHMLGSLVVRLEEGEEAGWRAIFKIIRSHYVVCSWLRGVSYTF